MIPPTTEKQLQHVAQFTFEELKAAVDVAKTWNTYVAVHVFTDKGAQTAIKAGVMSIEHGNLMTEETFKMMKEKGVWFGMQPILNDEDAMVFPPGSAQEKKFIEVTDVTVRGVDPHNKFVMIMKGGKIYKNTIH